jgi:hypothetical protein
MKLSQILSRKPKALPSKVFVVCQAHKYSDDSRVIGIFLNREAAEKVIRRAGKVLCWREDRFMNFALVWAQVRVKLPQEEVHASMWIEEHSIKGFDAVLAAARKPGRCACELGTQPRRAPTICAAAIALMFLIYAFDGHSILISLVQTILLATAFFALAGSVPDRR